MSAARSVLVASLGLALLACGPASYGQAIGLFDGDGFHPVPDHYRVRYLEDRALMTPEWRLTNFGTDSNGAPTVASQLDANFLYYEQVATDSSRPSSSMRWPHADLFFRRDTANSEIWSRTIPLDDHYASSSLAELVRASLSGRSDAPSLFARQQVRPENGYVIDEERVAVVDGRRGYAALFHDSGSNLNHPRRGAVVVVDSRGAAMGTYRSFPLVVVFGIHCPPDRWEERLPDFESFVRRADFRD